MATGTVNRYDTESIADLLRVTIENTKDVDTVETAIYVHESGLDLYALSLFVQELENVERCHECFRKPYIWGSDTTCDECEVDR